MKRTFHIVANWKMNRPSRGVEHFCRELHRENFSCNVWVAPQAMDILALLSTNIDVKIGAQNCSEHDHGAFTGEISPRYLKEMGVHFVIIGHSERRRLYNENDNTVLAKLHAIYKNCLTAVFCVGETLEEREKGLTESVVKKQLEGLEVSENLVIAYEPIWAIGTGKTATAEQAQEIHSFIRDTLDCREIIILYGGSLKPSNAKEILSCPDIDGGLVGGASLDPSSFGDICRTADQLGASSIHM